ncbi:hypothetical protein C4K18_1153 [Pseudomonas chlororaphis subsp. aurantiaca]|nr:hypothetical protein C4K18_1153 [Pseudomonas chlororaphis subsp. aurantiaca]
MEKTEQLLGAASVPDSPKIGKKAANKIELRVLCLSYTRPTDAWACGAHQ